MTKFEERGVRLQNTAHSSFQAESRFEYSCNLCCSNGMRIECDRCAIKVAHEAFMDKVKSAQETPKFRIEMPSGTMICLNATT